ncbi:hypothetical protein AB0K51_18540 [Kitasatospora sp. NPDC049285]|uniref:hypothetical protein n=1 Tax=Kitasatospora sp. NPDC049285 TaxID=3157096 RepID=UPI00343B7D58
MARARRSTAPSAASRSVNFTPSAGQLALGTLITAAAAVALLAVSGETGVWQVAVLCGFAVALGTLVTALVSSSPRRDEPATAPAPAAGQVPPSGQVPTAAPELPVRTALPQPEYARQSR